MPAKKKTTSKKVVSKESNSNSNSKKALKNKSTQSKAVSKKKTTSKKVVSKKNTEIQAENAVIADKTLQSLDESSIETVPPVVAFESDQSLGVEIQPEIDSRQYLVTLLLTILVVIGIFGAVNYFLAKNQDPWMPTQKANIIILDEAKNTAEVEIVEEENEANMTMLPERINVAVYNGSGISGLANEYAQTIEDAGFTVVEISNADSFNYQGVTIKYSSLIDSSLIDNLKKLFDSRPVETIETDDSEYNVSVTIGR